MLAIYQQQFFFFLISNCNLLNLEKHIQEVYRDLKKEKETKERKGSYKIRDTSTMSLKTPLDKRLR